MELKKIKEGKYTLEEAQKILGVCFLAEIPEYRWVTKQGRNYGYAYDPSPWQKLEEVGRIRIWQTAGGMYVEAA